ncbi:Tn3 family transposase [Escherichia coli]|nr:Tn3 family transposase [Escherichia coli]NNS42348.1 Tn3 family transposase [Escherichia coli]NNT46965.1 Tn3 family transposase [Escherichia coli]NNT60895.1 Tn3 family transposase [Escherichia coli]NNT65707.1 Tn3 family transposase [Escherichia coli]
MPAFEWVHVQLHQQKGMISLSPPTICNSAVLWNTLYMQEALSHLRSAGEIPEDEHISRLSPLMYGHINMLGHYTFTLPENILKGELRPLNFNSNNELLP